MGWGRGGAGNRNTIKTESDPLNYLVPALTLPSFKTNYEPK